jgi:hypothetical protein
MFSKFRLVSSSFLLLTAAACRPTDGTSAMTPGLAANANGQTVKVQSLSANTCLTSKVGPGKLYDGSRSIPSYPVRDTLTQGDQAIYVVGKFPDQFNIVDNVTPELKGQLLAKATAWEWELGPEQDANGQTTQFHLDKEVLNPDDNQAYVVSQKIYNFGDQVMVQDNDEGINIQCNIPAN